TSPGADAGGRGEGGAEHGSKRTWTCASSRAQATTNAGAIGAALLDLYLGALFFERGLDLLGLVAVDAFLDGLRRRVDEILGLLEAEAGQLADDLDDRDLVGADLGQDGRELGLLLDD